MIWVIYNTTIIIL